MKIEEKGRALQLHDLRLVAEFVGREHEASQLQHLLDVVETRGGFHLGEEVESARARRVRRLLDTHLVGAASGQALPMFSRDLAGNVKQRPSPADWHQSGRHVRGKGRWRRRQLDAELTEAFMG